IKVVEVCVVVTDFLQAGVAQCSRLGLELLCRRVPAEAAPATPTEHRRGLEAISRCPGILLAFHSDSACQQYDSQRSPHGMCQISHDDHPFLFLSDLSITKSERCATQRSRSEQITGNPSL